MISTRKIFGLLALAAALAFSAAPSAAFAATVFSDSFGTGSTDTNLAPTWVEGGAGAEKRAASSGNDSASPDGGRFATIFGTNGPSKGYICANVNAVGYTGVNLSYFWRGDADSNNPSDDGIVEFKPASGGSCADSSGWTQLQNHDMQIDGSWSTQAAFTNAGFSNASFLLRFRAETNQSDEHFRVDGVAVTGTLAPTTGTIRVVKTVVNDNGGTKVVADFPLFVGTTTVASGATTTVNAGTYVVSETSQTGYTATIGGDCASNGSVTVAAGQNKVCTITNDDQPAKLVVVKSVVNDNGGTKVVADFPLFVGTTTVVSGATSTLNAGTYAVSETASAGYVGTFGGACDASGHVTLGLGETKTCTLVNDDVAAKLVVTKVVNGGTKVVSDFPLFVGTTTVASGATTTVNAGTYVVSETNQAHYVGVISGDCATNGSITLAPGDVKACTITNTYVPPTGTLTVTKVVVGSDAATSTFPLTLDGLSITSGVATTTLAGEHTVAESGAEGYAASWSEGCDGGHVTVPEEGSVSCTLTNTFIPTKGAIVITKNVIDALGLDVSDSASFTVHLNVEAASGSVAEGSSLTFSSLTPGDYTITEDAAEGYSLDSISPATTVSVTAGATTTVTIVNRQAATTTEPTTGVLVITKNVVASNGETDVEDTTTFTVRVNAGEGMTVGEGAPISLSSLAPGEYGITENAMEGYELVSISPATATVTAGATTTVTIVNRQVGESTSTPTYGQLTFTKVVRNNEVGTKEVSDFPLYIDGEAATSGEAVEIESGAHTLTEESSEGYAASWSEGCDGGHVTVPAEQKVECVLTNTWVGTTTQETSGGSSSRGDSRLASHPDHSRRGGHRHGASNGGGAVLGASTGPNSCQPYLTSYIWPNRQNDPAQVTLLQKFLNEFEQAGLDETGAYDAPTQAAVGKFQVKYSLDVLAPWVNLGLWHSEGAPSLNVYKLTLWKINALKCGTAGELPKPQLP